jgi:hypothetical protein
MPYTLYNFLIMGYLNYNLNRAAMAIETELLEKQASLAKFLSLFKAPAKPIETMGTRLAKAFKQKLNQTPTTVPLTDAKPISEKSLKSFPEIFKGLLPY